MNKILIIQIKHVRKLQANHVEVTTNNLDMKRA